MGGLPHLAVFSLGHSVDLPLSNHQANPIASRISPDGRLASGRLAGLTMNRAIWVLSWPILTESVLNSFVGLTDTILAAGLDDGGAAADAIGGASYVLWFIGLIVAALGVGSTALISRAVGKGRFATANAALGQTALLAVCLGAAVAALVALLAAPVATLLNLSPEASKAFRLFMLINTLGVPMSSFLYGMTACVRGAGDSRTPLTAMVLVNIVNILLSWTLAGVDLKTSSIVDGQTVSRVLLHNPFEFNLGVRGIAIGTITAELIGALYMLWVVNRGVGGIKLHLRRVKPHLTTIARLARVGWPNFLETLGMWLGNFMIILMVGWMGQGMLGAHIVAIRIEGFSFLPGFAMGTAAATLVGQYLGAGSPEFARRAVWRCATVAISFMTLGGIVFMAIPQLLVGLLSSQPAHLHAAPGALFIAGCVQIPFAAGLVFRSAIRGAGDVKAAMWITWITTYAVRLPLAYLLSGVTITLPESLGGTIQNPSGLEPSLSGLWLGLCIEICVRCALFAWRFFHGAWTRAKV